MHPDWEAEYQAKNGTVGPLPAPGHAVGDGTLGILEGTSNPLYHDGQQGNRWYIRGDVVGEVAMSYAMHGRVFDDDSSRQVAQNLISYLDDPNHPLAGGAKSDPATSAYGLRGWDATPNGSKIYYSDDLARSLLGQLAVAGALNTQEYNEQIVTKTLAMYRLTGVNGFWTRHAHSGTLSDPNWWVGQHNSTAVDLHPHFESYKWAPMIWLADKASDQEMLDRVKTGISMVMDAYDNDTIKWTNGLQQERAHMLLPLAWLVRTEDTPQHRAWLRQIFVDIVADMDASGAIAEELGRPGFGQYPAPTSNASYGSTEEPVIFENGDPAADLLYTSNFALKGFIEAAAATGDQDYIDAANLLGDFMVRSQITSGIEEVDGSWVRGFDFERWEYFGADGDHGWGVLGDQAGWTSGEIISSLALLEMDTSLWDLTAGLDVASNYGAIKAQMFSALYGSFDLNSDGNFDVNDWIDVFQPNLGRNLIDAGVTAGEAAALGDLNGDFRVDIRDYRLFRNAYDDLYGVGALQAAVSVPEPSTCWLAGALVFAFRAGQEHLAKKCRTLTTLIDNDKRN